jgi:Leucine-rich repeat (LRR) protein
LWLYDCGIQEINPKIAKLINLQKLWLDRNPIRLVPDALLSLNMLQELYLDQTDVSEFPDYFRDALTNLKIVALNTTQ